VGGFPQPQRGPRKELITTTTATADLSLPVDEDTVTESVKAVAPLGALMMDAVPLCTPAVRGVQRGPAYGRAHGVRTRVTD
jgi:hypothetical protein